MTPESPFYTMRIECPVCLTANDFESIKVGAYAEAGRDADFRPNGRTWRQPEYQHLDPLFYSVATCSSCFYTRELDGNYKNWSKDKRFTLYRQKPLREAHLKALGQAGSPVRLLGSHLDLKRHPCATTINKLLLGVLDEEAAEGGDRLNVARFYLRISWMFRDLGSHVPPVDARVQNLSAFQSQLSETVSSLEQSLSDLRRLAAQLRGVGQTTEFEDALEHLAQAALAVLSKGQALRPMATGTPQVEAPRAVPYFEYPHYTAFLKAVGEAGFNVPLCEEEALAQALHHYKEYFEHSRTFPSPELEVQTAYLIAELARRLSRSRDAAGYFNHAIRKGQELLHEYQNDPNRSAFLRKLVELAVDQGRKNRDEQEAQAAA